jgi:hypothetical protein
MENIGENCTGVKGVGEKGKKRKRSRAVDTMHEREKRLAKQRKLAKQREKKEQVTKDELPEVVEVKEQDDAALTSCLICGDNTEEDSTKRIKCSFCLQCYCPGCYLEVITTKGSYVCFNQDCKVKDYNKAKCERNLRKAFNAQIHETSPTGVVTRSKPLEKSREQAFKELASRVHAKTIIKPGAPCVRKCPHCECPFGQETITPKVKRLFDDFQAGMKIKVPHTICAVCKTESCDICGQIAADHLLWVNRNPGSNPCDYCREMARRLLAQEAQRLIDDEKSNKDVKKCPRCTVFVHKEEGCNHMTCQSIVDGEKCGQEFCYVCGDALQLNDVTDHFNPKKNPKGCLQFDQEEEDDDDPIWGAVNDLRARMEAHEARMEDHELNMAVAASMEDTDRELQAALALSRTEHARNSRAEARFRDDVQYRTFLHNRGLANSYEALQEYYINY